MALVPFSYNVRSLLVRAGNTWLTVFSIGATVAVLAGVLSLQQGFASMFAESGRDDLLVLLRKGATSEGESAFDEQQAQVAVKETAEFAADAAGRPLAAAELYLAALLPRRDGGETNVTLRGVPPATFAIHGDDIRIVDGQNFQAGSDEVIVGRAVSDRMRDCRVGDVLTINVTPFRVVGVFDGKGSHRSEIWGDVQRMQAALQVDHYSRVLGKLRPGADVAALSARMLDDRRLQAKAMTEAEYLRRQTGGLTGMFVFLGTFLGLIMGIAAVFTGTNAMLSALAARTHEIGILLAVGFRPWAVFASFLFEAVLLGLCGGIAGVLLVLPLNGMQTGTTNFNTFTEVSFAFRTTPLAMAIAVGFAMLLGLGGGLLPALRAARLPPTQALRRG